jgi:hypothetical protein
MPLNWSDSDSPNHTQAQPPQTAHPSPSLISSSAQPASDSNQRLRMLYSKVAVAAFFDGERITFHGPWRSNNVEIVRYCFPLCGLMAGEFPSSVFTFQKNTEYRALLRNQSPALGGCGETIFVINNLHVDCGSLLPLSNPQPAVDNRGKHEQPSDPLVWQ